MTTLTILLMAVITFSTRYLLIHPKIPIRLTDKVRKFLSFSAPAVLTAIWVPIIFVHHGQLNFSLMNPYLIAATVAVITSAKTKNIYLTMIIGLIVFVAMHFIIPNSG